MVVKTNPYSATIHDAVQADGARSLLHPSIQFLAIALLAVAVICFVMSSYFVGTKFVSTEDYRTFWVGNWLMASIIAYMLSFLLAVAALMLRRTIGSILIFACCCSPVIVASLLFVKIGIDRNF